MVWKDVGGKRDNEETHGEGHATRGHFSSVNTPFSIVIRTTDGKPPTKHEEIK